MSLVQDYGRDFDSYNLMILYYHTSCIQKCQAISTDIYIPRTCLSTKNGLTTKEQVYAALKVKIIQRLGVYFGA
ncbi:MAG: hypothetical protein ABJB76_05780 [Candidatus Nitrosocosmicus sp.]